jgi:hypothetical protein
MLHTLAKGGFEMDKIFTAIRNWLQTLTSVECPPDALSTLDLGELADIPPAHPSTDDGCAC